MKCFDIVCYVEVSNCPVILNPDELLLNWINMVKILNKTIFLNLQYKQDSINNMHNIDDEIYLKNTM